MFVIKICHSYEQFYITVTKKKLSYEMHQYDKQCLLLLQKNFISVKTKNMWDAIPLVTSEQLNKWYYKLSQEKKAL